MRPAAAPVLVALALVASLPRTPARAGEGEARTVEVRVMAAETIDSPVRGARVVALRVPGDGPLDPDPVLGGGGVETDGDGRARVAVPAGEGRVLLAVVGPGRAPVLAAVPPAADGAGVLDVDLPRAAGLVVRVTAAEVTVEGDPPADAPAAGVDLRDGTAVAGAPPAAGELLLLGAVRPLAGVTVRFTESGERAAGSVPAVRRWARTGEDGRAFVPDLPVDRPWRVDVVLEGFAPGVADQALAGGAPVSITLLPGAGVRGRVVEAPGGAPAAGARVRVAGFEAVTDGEGRFLLTDLPAGATAVEVSHRDALPLDRPAVHLRPGGIAQVGDLRVQGLVAVEARFRDPEGRPVAGVRATLLPAPGADGGGVEPALSDALGAVRLERVPPTVGHRLLVEPPLPLAAEVLPAFAVLPREGIDLGVVHLRPAGSLRGRVEDDGGRAVPGAEVLILPAHVDPLRALADPAVAGPPGRVVATDGEGVFACPGLAAGDRVVVARAAGHAPSPVLFAAVREGAETLLEAPLVVRAGESISGRVVDAAGAPLEGAEISNVPAGSQAMVRARTGADGSFRLDGLLRREHGLRVHLRPGDLRPAVRTTAVAPASGLLVRVPASHPIEGTVDDPSALRPLGTVQVFPLGESAGVGEPPSPWPEEVASVPVTEARTFRTPPLPEGRYRVSLRHAAGWTASADVTVGVEPPPAVVLVARRGAVLRGRTLVRGGAAAAGVRLRVLVGGTEAGIVPPAISEADGAFEIPGVPPGEHLLAFDGGPAALGGEARVAVPEGQDSVELDPVELLPAVTVSLLLRGEAGGPLAGVFVELRSASGAHASGATGGSGVAVVHAAPGWHRATFRMPDGTVLRRPLLVPAGSRWEEVVDLLSGGDRDLRVLRRGAPVAGARVRIASVEAGPAGLGASVDGVADDDGVARLPSLPDGPAVVEVVPPGETPVRLLVDLAGQRTTVSLPAGGLAGEVREEESSRPVSGARIDALPVGADGPVAESFRARPVSTVSDAGGAFSFGSLPPGIWMLEVSGGGRGTVRAGPFLVDGGGAAAVSVALPREAALEGRVLAAGGAPVAGARVTAATGGSAPREASTLTSAGGRYVLEGLGAGPWEVTARAAGLGSSVEEALTLAPGERRALDLHLMDGGTLEIQVMGAGGVPVPRAQVTVTDMFGTPAPFPAPGPAEEGAPPPPAAGRTDGEGRTGIPGLRAGTYVVSARAEGLEPSSTRVRVDPLTGGRALVVLLPPAPPPAPRDPGSGGTLLPPPR